MHEALEISEGMVAWSSQHYGPLAQAGSEHLLPSKEFPTQNRLAAHALQVVLISASETSSKEFRVTSASVVPLDQLKRQIENARPDGPEDTVVEAIKSPRGLEAAKGKGVAGVMWFVMFCEDPPLLGTYVIVISKEVLERRLMMESLGYRWLDQLKAFTAPGVQGYKVGGDGTLLDVTTRRAKAKRTGDLAPAESIASPTTLISSTLLTPRWMGLIDEDDRELPNLKD
ncbi:hypothetical protein FRB95_001106 [Tulasnella sp. JGI-2019a]|nr:hypothetical protein FRB95_001106 [Tulasnella sp. JGI-2019a]